VELQFETNRTTFCENILFELKHGMLVDNPPFVFYFRVKFYVSEPSKLKEEYTRYSGTVSLHIYLFLKISLTNNA